MASAAEKAIEIFKGQVGKPDGAGDWIEVDQDRINLFADATLDHQFIHIDPEKSAKLSPYKVTIAHGFLTLSLLPHLTASIPQQNPAAYEGVVMGVNYGLDKVRFPAPVPVNSKLRAHREMMDVTLVNPNTLQVKNKVTIEIEGSEKPACVAEFLTRMIYG
ncbi:MAG TPA: MaoC family dehydratase [Pseudomonadales bacterium]|nr:MaoC family dehydratase [Pseudomonadales bacterium]